MSRKILGECELGSRRALMISTVAGAAVSV